MSDTTFNDRAVQPADRQLLRQYRTLAIKAVSAAAAFRSNRTPKPASQRNRLVPGGVLAGEHGSD